MNLSLTAPISDNLSAVSSSTILGTMIPGESIKKAKGYLQTLNPVSDLVVQT